MRNMFRFGPAAVLMVLAACGIAACSPSQEATFNTQLSSACHVATVAEAVDPAILAKAPAGVVAGQTVLCAVAAAGATPVAVVPAPVAATP